MVECLPHKQINTTLKTLQMRRNKVGDLGASKLADCLKINTSLTSLELTCNPIPAGGYGEKALIEALSVNPSICHYDGPLAQELEQLTVQARQENRKKFQDLIECTREGCC